MSLTIFRIKKKIQGQKGPLVSEYTYLGLKISKTLKIEDIASSRVKMARKKVHRILPF